jgi:hypothetical protein
MTKSFARFVAKEAIREDVLCEAITRASTGLIDADLGGGVIKQRLAREGQGKSGGFRTIILYRAGALAFFAYGFAKNERDNISPKELRAFRKLAGQMLQMNEKALIAAMRNGTITEIHCNA